MVVSRNLIGILTERHIPQNESFRMSRDLLKSSMHTTTADMKLERGIIIQILVDYGLLVIELIRSDPMVYGRLNLRSDQGELIDRLIFIRVCPFPHHQSYKCSSRVERHCSTISALLKIDLTSKEAL